MEDKEMERLRAEAAAKKEAMREMEEHSREKEMERLRAEAAAKKEMEDRMMAKMNGFVSSSEEEELSPKRR